VGFQSVSLERTLLDHHKEDWDQNQNVNHRCDHPADNRGGDGFHNIRPDAGLPQDCTRLANTAVAVINLGRNRRTAPSIAASSMPWLVSGAPEAMSLQCLMQVDHHNNSGLHCYAK
jgi:hypothetical protein